MASIIPIVCFADFLNYLIKPQTFKAILPSQLKYCVTVLEIIPEIVFGKRHEPGLNSFIQKDCVIFYRCVTGNHTENYSLITCLSVTSPSRIVVLKLSNKA